MIGNPFGAKHLLLYFLQAVKMSFKLLDMLIIRLNGCFCVTSFLAAKPLDCGKGSSDRERSSQQRPEFQFDNKNDSGQGHKSSRSSLDSSFESFDGILSALSKFNTNHISNLLSQIYYVKDGI